MKRNLKYIFSTLLVMPLLFMTVVFAEESTTTSDTTKTESSETAEATEIESPKPDDKNLLERLEKRKTDLKTRLTSAEKTRIKSKCVASQGSVSSVKGRIKGIETSRTRVHKNIVKHFGCELL